MVSISYNLPYKTVEVLKGSKSGEEFNPDKACQNMGLLLDKYMPGNVFATGIKGEWLSRILKPIDDSKNQSKYIDSDFFRQVYRRWDAMMRSLGIAPFHLGIDWRMIVGLGGETILETDLTLHHLYGIPIIPGSALKGLTRAYIVSEKKEYFVPQDKPEKERHASKRIEEDHSDLKRIFGEQEKAGTVCFFDAMPVNGQVHYVVDIMNPHYPDYYRSLQSTSVKPPANDQSPNPVTFLTVADTTFAFAVAPRKPHDVQHQADVKLVRIWLLEALQKYGIGGKTSAGYGYFKVEQGYSRPEKLAQYQQGQEIRGVVLDENTDKIAARYVGSGRASKCLQLLPFSSNEVLILIPSIFEEARKWKTRNVSVCQFIEERVEDNRTLLICEPKKKK